MLQSVTNLPQRLIKRISNQSFNHIYLDGGAVIHEFLEAGLINEITVTTVSIITGNGKTYTGILRKDILLQTFKNNIYIGSP